jgi:hypothetical protein
MTAPLIEMNLAADAARAAGNNKLTKQSVGALLDRYDALVCEATLDQPRAGEPCARRAGEGVA